MENFNRVLAIGEVSFMAGLILLVPVFLVASSLFIVSNKTIRVVERLGKFHKIARPGLNFKIPVIDRIAGGLSLKVEQLQEVIETKTKDNVFIRVPIAVQYTVIPGSEERAYYSLSNPEEQMLAFIADAVRVPIAEMSLDESFLSKQKIAEYVSVTLEEKMSSYGYEIISTLVTDIQPDEDVKRSMNSINAALRDKEAAQTRAEAKKIEVIKEAEAEAEARKLAGQGVAAQRRAIIEGLAEQHRVLEEAGVKTDPELLIMFAQQLDTNAEMARSAGSKIIFQPVGPGSLSQSMTEIKTALMSSENFTKVS